MAVEGNNITALAARMAMAIARTPRAFRARDHARPSVGLHRLVRQGRVGPGPLAHASPGMPS